MNTTTQNFTNNKTAGCGFFPKVIIQLSSYTLLVCFLISCNKAEILPNGNTFEKEWVVTHAGNVVYEKSAILKFSNGDAYEYVGNKAWSKYGTYTIKDSIFMFISNTGSTKINALFKFSATGDTLYLRTTDYKYQYPNGGEPKDILRIRR